ncbi:unnamed protein product [Didymodactylos carnosus]|uniref:Uncharacterized protein n=1 Tax=Didymodactylos carnosus TaxID=1234261 RepID=A0A814SD17_9BILA|nr:unnamed protein product [Didymodactylos carnosus]CAF3910011.1 unnamed protein product [Didymodactylos carnosus]
MWLRSKPEKTYFVSSDISQGGRIDVPLISTSRQKIPPYHLAFIQVTVPSSITTDSWDASITSVGRKIHTANSWIRIKDRKSFVQVANCSASSSYIRPGQKVALADLLEYSSQNKDSANEYQSESPMPKQKGLDKDIEETNRGNGAEDRGLFSLSLANDMLSAEGFPIRGTSEAKDCLVPLQEPPKRTESKRTAIPVPPTEPNCGSGSP